MSDKITCPRRAEGYGAGVEYEDEFRDRHGDGYKTCSFCGSISQEEFFSAVDDGAQLIPTDKNYKVYVGPGHRKFYFQHLDEAGRKRFIEDNNEGNLHLAEPGYFYRTPFFARTISHDYEADPPGEASP